MYFKSFAGRDWVEDKDSAGGFECRTSGNNKTAAVRRRGGLWWCQPFQDDKVILADCHKEKKKKRAFSPSHSGYKTREKAIAAVDAWIGPQEDDDIDYDFLNKLWRS